MFMTNFILRHFTLHFVIVLEGYGNNMNTASQNYKETDLLLQTKVKLVKQVEP